MATKTAKTSGGVKIVTMEEKNVTSTEEGTANEKTEVSPGWELTSIEKQSFECAKEFVTAMYEFFTAHGRNITVYKTVLDTIRDTTQEGADEARNVLSGFRAFFQENDEVLINEKIVPPEARIYYGASKTAYVPIGASFSSPSADSETKKNMVKHLITISTMMEYSKKKMRALKNPEDVVELLGDSEEDKMVSEVFKKINSSGIKSSSDPYTAVMGLLANGTLKDMIDSTQARAQNGNINGKRLIVRMQALLGKIADSME